MDWLHAFLYTDARFVNFSATHLLMVGLTATLSVGLPLLATRYLEERGRLVLGRVIAVWISFAAVGSIVLRRFLGEFAPLTDIPLNLCPLTSTLLPFLVWNPKQRIHEILYFFVLVGTLQGVLTPDLVQNAPHYMFFRYWSLHAGLVVAVIYYTATFGLYPTGRSLLRAFGWLQAYIAVVLLVNFGFGTNFMYLMEKPPSRTLLDLLGPWPWYLLSAEALALVLFLVVYLPVYATRRNLPSAAPALIRRD
jgi:hypothetical integral membrane protein (TIGR02206 family)